MPVAMKSEMVVRPSKYKISKAIINACFTYDKITGFLYWKHRGTGHLVGARAGCVDPNGYIKISFRGKAHKAHRLIWLMHYGYLPDFSKKLVIDHINRIKTDNRLENLREVTISQNIINSALTEKTKNNTSGLTGVYWNKIPSKWAASISIQGKSKYLGLFGSFFDACCARKSAEIKYKHHEIKYNFARES